MKSLHHICEIVSDKISVNELNNANLASTYISTENMLPNKGGVVAPSSVPTTGKVTAYKTDDVLVSNIRPYFKKIWFATNGGGCSNDVLVFRAKKDIFPEYLHYVLADDSFFDYAMKTSKGTKMPRGDKKALMEYEIVKMDYSSQCQAATILKRIDDLIKTNTKINENLEQQAQALYRQVFVNADDNQSATIADISLNVTDGVHNTVKDDPEGNYLLLSCKNIKGGSLSIGSSERHINKETFDKLRKRTQLAKGDILISSVGTIGETLMLNTEPKNYEFQRSVAMIKPDTKIVSSAYVYESLLYKKAELINAAHGAVQQCLFISDICEFPIDIPSKVKLDMFNSAVIPMFDIITAKHEENQRLAALRDILLPKLMSGELDVSQVQI